MVKDAAKKNDKENFSLYFLVKKMRKKIYGRTTKI